jgi:hypothetical protein
MKAKFEEKTYECYFNDELNAKSSVYFPPGQVQEGILGIDSAAYSRSWWLWRRLGFPFMIRPNFAGINLRDVADVMEQYLGKEVRNIPKMKVNLMLQYKSAEYCSSKKGKEWNLWNQAYFRYKICKKQQDLLSYLDSHLAKKASVMYAAPAICDVDDLVTLKKQHKVIENSNFQEASKLAGHRFNTYIKAGTFSQPCSDPERIKDLDLLGILKQHDQISIEPNGTFIESFAKDVAFVIGRYNRYSRAYNSLMEDYHELEKYPLLIAFLRMKVFREITGIQWIIGLQ